jgi:hypothetical protein
MTLKTHIEGGVPTTPYEEHYKAAYWAMVKKLQEVFARTCRPSPHDQIVYEACRQRMGADKVVRLARGHRQQILDRVGTKSPWAYFRGILQSKLHNPEADPVGCEECGEQMCGLKNPETWTRRQGVRLSFDCPTCGHITHSPWCYPGREGARPTVRWDDYVVQSRTDRGKAQKWKEALRGR